MTSPSHNLFAPPSSPEDAPVFGPAKPSLWRELVTENPLIEEGRREQRRFFRVAAGNGRFGRVVIGIAILFYVWLLIESAATRTDLTMVYSFVELVALTLCLPGSVYGAISGEREKSTWEALILTRLTPWQIIAGKLIWRVRMIGMIVGFLLPPLLISRVLAPHVDMPLSAVLYAQLILISWGLLLCGFGLWVSSLTQRSITTLAVIACSMIGVLVALPTLYSLFASMLGNWSSNQDPYFSLMMQLNPFAWLNYVLSPDNPADAAYLLGSGDLSPCAVYLILTVVLIYLTNKRLRQLETPGRRPRPRSFVI